MKASMICNQLGKLEQFEADIKREAFQMFGGSAE